MIAQLYYLALILVLAGVLHFLLAPRADVLEPGLAPLAKDAGTFFLLVLLSSVALAWAFSRRLGPDRALSLALAAEAAGALSFALARRASPEGAARSGFLGAVAGLLFSLLGFCSWRWMDLLTAFARLGFGGKFFGALLPFFLAVSLAAVTALLLRPDLRRLQAALLSLLILLWAGSAALTERHLRSAWDYPRASLSQAAEVPGAAQAVTEAAAVLVHGAALREDFRFERRIHAVGRVDASPESLRKVAAYLESRGYRSLFKREGLLALRQGWLGHWEAERALETAGLCIPGKVEPDYLLALGLLRAGPIIEARFHALEKLHLCALSVPGGFEDVSRSQLIFEAFSAAYGRFGDEERSRYWLGRVDSLWPLYEKKIEVSPVETMRDGVISGVLRLDGRPASSVRVGLFLETRSQATGRKVEELSGSVFPDSEGRFGFESLGPGGYHLELMGTPEQIKGRIENSPGIIELFDGRREALLPPIRIDRAAKPLPPLPLPGLDSLLIPDPLNFGVRPQS